MSSRTERLWLVVAAISSLGIVAAFVVVVVTPVPVVPNLYLAGILAFPVVGGLVLSRQPGNTVGRLLVSAGSWFAIGASVTTYLWLSLEVGPLPLADLAAWLGIWTNWPPVPLMALMVAVFPSGRLASAWLRIPLTVGAIATLLLIVTLMLLPAPVNVVFFGEEIINPWGADSLAPLVPVDSALPILATALLAITIADLILRWRRARGVERLQMRWVGLGLLSLALLAIAGVAAEAAGFTPVLIALWLGFGTLPASIGIAVTRYRLYEIDRLVSRTVSYALVVGVLAAVFAMIAVGIPQLVGLGDQSPPQLVAGATLVVAALFNPLRRRVQAGVDRRFNRARYDAQKEVDWFAGRLRDQVDLDDLTGDLTGVVAKTMQPSMTTLWVRGDGG